MTGSLLELGAGLGQDSIFFATKGFDVTCTDYDIDSAVVNVQGHSEIAGKIKIKKVDLRDTLHFEVNKFDIVYAHLSLHYFDDATTVRIFADIHRILKPGGIFAFFTNSTVDPEYDNGKKIEDDYFDIDGTPKRYLSVITAESYAKEFDIVILDNNGETYKDSAKDIHNLIRYIGKK